MTGEREPERNISDIIKELEQRRDRADKKRDDNAFYRGLWRAYISLPVKSANGYNGEVVRDYLI